ncbi:MAG: YicC family protein, partial [Pseudomonadota bacterium]|nr:YicC family protein [Pseudomonadota bacterium]
MTGYAVATSEGAAGTLTIEIKSVNSRFLDLQFRINDELRALEPDLRAAIMAAITRGKVEARLSFGRKVAGGSQALNAALLADLARLQGEVARHFVSAPVMSVAELLRWPGVIEEAQVGQESLQADVAALTATTVAAFVNSRQREGAALEAMLLTRIDAMDVIVKRITPLIPQVIAQFQQKAVERMQDALGLAGHGTPSTLTRQEAFERIRQEVTLYGIRIDVSEELSRLTAHLMETRHILKKGGQVGKRLDFMMQELNREANTLGAKASVKELA